MPPNLDPNSLLQAVLEGIGQPFYTVDRDWRIQLYNDVAARHFGRPASEMIGRRLWDVFPEDREHERGRILRDAMELRQPVHGETMSMIGQFIAYSIFPLGDGLGIAFRDVTDRRQAEQRRDAAESALLKRTLELETVLETIPTAVWFTYDREVKTLIGNRRAAELLRSPAGTFASLSARQAERPTYRFYRDGVEASPESLPTQRAARGEEVDNDLLEVRFGPGEEGDRRLLLMRATPLRDSAGEIQGAVCAAADVTERHRYEDHLKLLLNELNHRVKNTLAVVQSIAALTLKGTDPAARADFEHRLLTLSAVHTLLTDANWDGVQIRALVDAALKPHIDGVQRRLAFEGPDFRLRPKSAETLSMALHELATNAVKYGALSSASGEVALAWTIEGGRFRLRWEERGGPPVVPPARKGFGSRLIERGLAAELRGEVRIDYRPHGVICTIDAPFDVLRDDASRDAPP